MPTTKWYIWQARGTGEMLNRTFLSICVFSLMAGSLIGAWFRGYLNDADLIALRKLLFIMLFIALILMTVRKMISPKSNEVRKNSGLTYVMIACVSLACFGVGCFLSRIWIHPSDEELFYMAYGDEGLVRLHKLKSIKPDTVAQISIFDKDGETLLKVVTKKELISEFAEACKDVRIYSPNHPTYTDSWYVVIDMGTEHGVHEVECHFELHRPKNLDGYLVVKAADTTRCLGSFTSVNLRGWFERHVKR